MQHRRRTRDGHRRQCLGRILATAMFLAVLGGCAPAAEAPPEATAGTQSGGGNDSAPGTAGTAASGSSGAAIRAEFMQIADSLERANALFLGGSRVSELRQRLQANTAGPVQEIEMRTALAKELLRLGRSSESLAEFQRVLQMESTRWQSIQVQGQVDAYSTEELPRRKEILFRMVIAAMRVGEDANCVTRHNPASCILPIRRDAVHVDQAGATTAMSYALEYLKLDPEDLKAIWFLNLAAMLVDRYPDAVPEEFRIPPETFTSGPDIGRFENIAPALGINTFDLAGASVAEDLDNDGFIDLLTSTMDPRGPLTYLHNQGDGTFEDRTVAAGLDVQLGGLNGVHADYNNDGQPDILILRGGWLQNQGHIRNSLLRNNGDGTFSDVTREAGLDSPAHPTQAAGWADYDKDGDLDLYIGNEGERQGGSMSFFADNLFRNNGDGTFTDVAAEAGVTNDRYAKGVAWGDYDGDDYPDLYVSNIGANRLFHNNGDGTFTDVAPRLGVTEPAHRSFATWFFDHDNDGDLDLFVVSYRADVADVAADLLGYPREDSGLWPRLYRNDEGRFTDITVQAGLDHPSLPMGANFGDLNEDGFLDIYLGTGAPAYEALMPNVMYLNNTRGGFDDVTFSGGFGHLQKGHGISFADFDNDGDSDIALQAGGFFPGDRFSNALFENPGHGHRFVAVRAEGRRSNRSAIGTRIRVRVATPQGERALYRWVGTGGSFGSSSLEQTIGLGDATGIVSLDLYWPVTGQWQSFTSVPLDSHLHIIEGESEFKVVERRRLHFPADHSS